MTQESIKRNQLIRSTAIRVLACCLRFSGRTSIVSASEPVDDAPLMGPSDIVTVDASFPLTDIFHVFDNHPQSGLGARCDGCTFLRVPPSVLQFCFADVGQWVFQASDTIRVRNRGVITRITPTSGATDEIRLDWTLWILEVVAGKSGSRDRAVSTGTTPSRGTSADRALWLMQFFTRFLGPFPRGTQVDAIHAMGVFPPLALPAMIPDGMGGSLNAAFMNSALITQDPLRSLGSRNSRLRRHSAMHPLSEFKRPRFPSAVSVSHAIFFESWLDAQLPVPTYRVHEFKSDRVQIFWPYVVALGGTVVPWGALICAPGSSVIVEVVQAMTIAICERSLDPRVMLYSINSVVYRVANSEVNLDRFIRVASQDSPALGDNFVPQTFRIPEVMEAEALVQLHIDRLNEQVVLAESTKQLIGFSTNQVFVLSIAIHDVLIPHARLESSAIHVMTLVAAVDNLMGDLKLEGIPSRYSSAPVKLTAFALSPYGPVIRELKCPLDFFIELASAVNAGEPLADEPLEMQDAIRKILDVLSCSSSSLNYMRDLVNSGELIGLAHEGHTMAREPLSAQYIRTTEGYGFENASCSSQTLPVSDRNFDMGRSALQFQMQGRSCSRELYEPFCLADPSHLLIARVLHDETYSLTAEDRRRLVSELEQSKDGCVLISTSSSPPKHSSGFINTIARAARHLSTGALGFLAKYFG